MLQALFTFEDPHNKFVFDRYFTSRLDLKFPSFLQFDVHYLLLMTCDITGSRAFESFMASEYPIDKKQQVIDKLKGNFVKVSLTNVHRAYCCSCQRTSLVLIV